LQVNPINRNINSRKYKLILDKGYFKDKDEGIKKAVSIVKSQVEQQGGTFKFNMSEENPKKVWYLDTKNHELCENTGLLIKVKENQAKSKYKVEIKVRKPDRNEAASYDLSSPLSNPKYEFQENKYKFEQDIKTPFDSIYSVSSIFEYKQKPDLYSYEDILSIYLSLSLDISDKQAKLVNVNDFEAEAFNPDLGEIIFANGKSAQTQLSIWYPPDNRCLPYIVEFDIDVKAEEESADQKK